jgi:formyl-CoA transferase/succinyl-CoA--D-citramalate CoA-transferase
LAALFAVVGILGAIVERDRSGAGQEVDVAIYEAVFALMESTLADYEHAGVVRRRTGSVLPGVSPSNVYPTGDGAEILIAANADSVFARLCEAMEEPELQSDERFATHQARGLHMEVLDAHIGEWTRRYDADTLLARLEEFGVPASRIFTAPDMLVDPHYKAREMIQHVVSQTGLDIPTAGAVPRFSRSQPRGFEAGPSLGQHTREVLMTLAGVDDDEWDALCSAGTCADPT